MRIQRRGSREVFALDEVACVTTFFDWSGNPWLARNHEIFRRHWENSGIPLYTVECHLKGIRPQLPPQPNLWRVLVKDPLFHKESAINFAVRKLPSKYRAIMYMDADMIVDDFQPLREVPRLLSGQTRAVQLISRVDYVDQDGRFEESKEHFSPETRHGFYGAGWAYRREFFDDHGGFFDGYPLGGLDTCALIAAYGEADHRGRRGFWRMLEPCMARNARAWCQVKQRYFGGQVRVLPTVARHLWHGDLTDRRYMDRHRILRSLPLSHYRRDRNGFVEFDQIEPRRYANVLKYWEGRRPKITPA